MRRSRRCKYAPAWVGACIAAVGSYHQNGALAVPCSQANCNLRVSMESDRRCGLLGLRSIWQQWRRQRCAHRRIWLEHGRRVSEPRQRS